MPPTGSLNKIPHGLLVERSLPEPATCTLPHCCGPWCRPDPPGALLAPRFGCNLRIFQQACPDRNQFEVKSMLSQYVATVVPSCLPGVAQSTRTRCLQRPAICSQLLGLSAEPPVGGRHARGHRHCSRCLPLDCRRGSSGCDCSESSYADQLAVGLLRGSTCTVSNRRQAMQPKHCTQQQRSQVRMARSSAAASAAMRLATLACAPPSRPRSCKGGEWWGGVALLQQPNSKCGLPTEAAKHLGSSARGRAQGPRAVVGKQLGQPLIRDPHLHSDL